MSAPLAARVKSVLSGDTLVLIPPNGNPSQERLLSLAYVQAPKLQSNEKYAFESREVLRTLLIGKEIKFTVLYKNNSGREFGDVSAPIFASLIKYTLEKGSTRLRDNVGHDDDDDDFVIDLKETEAKSEKEKIGLWDHSKVKSIELTSQLSKNERSKGPITAIVEKVISGDRLLIRFILSSGRHAVLPVLLSGIRCPRTASPDQPAEPMGETAKLYVESRLASKTVKVTIIGESSTGVLVGTVVHAVGGNVSEKLLADGLAEVSDWQSSLVGSETMSVLRRLEKTAKGQGKGLWKASAAAASAAAKSTGAASGSVIAVGKTLDATVARIISSDTIVIRLKNDEEVTVQLSSLRAPRQSDESTSAFVTPAREFVRSKCIGKKVNVLVDAIRPQSEKFDERPLVTITLQDGKKLADMIVGAGYATVIRHKRGDDDRSPDWDGLIESEALAIKKKKGIHGKAPEPERIVDASESMARAKPYLFSFQNRSKISCVVEHVVSGNRFRLFLPTDGARLTLILGGLANSGDRESETNKAAFALANKRLYQRDVQVDIYNVDKLGGFIGNLYLPNQTLPFQTTLLSQGLVEVHESSLLQTKFQTQFLDTEREAKAAKLGIWKDYDESEDINQNDEVAQVTSQLENVQISKKYYDVELVEILKDGTIALHILNEEKKKLSPFMKEFRAYNEARLPSLTKPPKTGSLVSAKFYDDGRYYRARVLGVDRASHRVSIQHIDYGYVDSLPLTDLRELPAQFSVAKYPAQAHIAQLSLIKIPSSDSKPGVYFLEDNVLGKSLIACENYHNPRPGVEMDVTLYLADTAASNPTYSVNKEMLEEGCAMVVRKPKGFQTALKSEWDELVELEKEAKRQHLGIWHHGDIDDSDDEI